MIEKQSRVDILDFLKLVTMFMVIWGHATQYVIEDSESLSHPTTKFFTSFLMPLFMILSGYFAKSSLVRSFWHLIKTKTIYILIPSLVWICIEYVILIFMRPDYHLTHSFSSNLFEGYWFIKSLYCCYIIYYILNKMFRNIYISALMGTLIVSSISFFEIWHIDTMLPFFFIGSIFSKPSISNVLFLSKDKIYNTVIFIFIYCILFYLWNNSYNFYNMRNDIICYNDSSISLNINNVGIYIFRLLIGFSGAIMTISISKIIFYKFEKKYMVNILTKWGMETFGLYMIHVFVLVILAKFYQFPIDTDIYIINFVYSVLYSLVALIISIFIIKIIDKFPKPIPTLLLGKNCRLSFKLI